MTRSGGDSREILGLRGGPGGSIWDFGFGGTPPRYGGEQGWEHFHLGGGAGGTLPPAQETHFDTPKLIPLLPFR